MLEFAWNASVLEVTSHTIYNNAIQYILRMRIVPQTTPCAPSSNMRTLSYILLQQTFNQARPRASSYKHQAGSCSAICFRLAQCCASGINMAQYCALSIKIAQCCVSGIIIMAQYCCIMQQWLWLNTVHPWLNAVHQASFCSSMLYIRHQYGSMLYIRHHIAQYCCIMHAQYNYGSMLCIHGSMLSGINMWLNAVLEALIWLNFAQYFASCTNIAQYCRHHAPDLGLNLVHKVWVKAVHPQLIDVHQASVWLNAIHQASASMAQLMLCIRHQYGSMQCNRCHL